jgi:hypothetical protein
MYKLKGHLSFEGLDIGITNGDSRVYLDDTEIGLAVPKRLVLGLQGVSVDDALRLAATDMVTGNLKTQEMPLVVGGRYGSPLKIARETIEKDPQNRKLRLLCESVDTIKDDSYVGFLFGNYDEEPMCHTMVRFGRKGVELVVTPKSETKYLIPYLDAEITGNGGGKTLRITRDSHKVLEEKLI